MNNVYAVVSETMYKVSYDRMEEDWYALAVIVAARTRGQARYLAVKSDRGLKGYSPLDWPRLWVKRLARGVWPDVGVLSTQAAEPWWHLCGEWNPGVNSGRSSD